MSEIRLSKTTSWHGGRPRPPLALYTPLRTIQLAGPAGLYSAQIASFNGSFKKMNREQRREYLLDLVQRGLVEIVTGPRGADRFVSLGDPETRPETLPPTVFHR